MTKRGYSSSYKPQDRAYYTRARTTIIKNGIELYCNICGIDSMIEIHHNNLDITDNSLKNLQPLCKSCHYALHNGIV